MTCWLPSTSCCPPTTAGGTRTDPAGTAGRTSCRLRAAVRHRPGDRRPPGPRHLAVHRPGRPQRGQSGPPGPAVVPRLMRVLVEGSGGAAGWPQPGCRCASCLRRVTAGNIRIRSTIVVDGRVRLGGGDTARQGRAAGAAGGRSRGAGAMRGRGAGLPACGGWRTRGSLGPGGGTSPAPDGGRLLYPARPGAVPVPPEDAGAYDVAFLDLLGDPAQLGLAQGAGADHGGHGHGGGVRRSPRALGAGTPAALRVLAGEADRGRRCGHHGPFGRKRS